MKTTFEIPDSLFTRLKARAAKEKTTMKRLIVAALQQALDGKSASPKRTFKLRDASFKGDGVREGVDLRDWESMRDEMYKGRGS